MPEDVHLLTAAAAFLLLAGGAAAQRLPDGVASYDTGLSRTAQAALARAGEGLSQTVVGRRLLADTADAVWREAPTGVPVSYRRSPPALMLDLKAASMADERDFELDLARELRRAELALPAVLPEEEQACRQEELAFAVQKAEADPAFAAALRKPAPGSEAESAARELALFVDDPQRVYQAIERGLPEEVRQASLPLIADLFAAHGGGLPAAVPPQAAYAEIEGRRYPAALVRAALLLSRDNGLRRAREALADFDDKDAHELRKEARRWLGR